MRRAEILESLEVLSGPAFDFLKTKVDNEAERFRAYNNFSRAFWRLSQERQRFLLVFGLPRPDSEEWVAFLEPSRNQSSDKTAALLTWKLQHFSRTIGELLELLTPTSKTLEIQEGFEVLTVILLEPESGQSQPKRASSLMDSLQALYESLRQGPRGVRQRSVCCGVRLR